MDKGVYLDVSDVYRIDHYGRIVGVNYLKSNKTHHLVSVNLLLVISDYAVFEDYPNKFNPDSGVFT